MKARFAHNRIAGVTLPEVLIATVTASIIMGGLMVGSIALQRSFAASDRLARAQSDLHRVADYMSRDIRNATGIDTTATSTVVVTITTSDYYDRRGTLNNQTDDVPNSPTLGRNGATYGANPVTIRYLRSGTQIFREVSQTNAGAATTTTTQIADNVQNLTVAVDAEGIATINSTSPMPYSQRNTGSTPPTISFVMASLPRNPLP